MNKDFFVRSKNFAVRKSFKFLEKWAGVHVTPVHFYSPIPTTYALSPKVFAKIYECDGIQWNTPEQTKLLSQYDKYSDEFQPTTNRGLTLVDSAILFHMIREHKPKVMIEIGSGATTEIALSALKKNREEGFDFQFYAIEPYPTSSLLKVSDPGFTLIQKNLQDVPLDLLQKADLLFIDSTHVSRIDSDVNYEILEIVPKLKKGALIHWHDIVMPKNYSKEWIDNGNQFWNESYMLHAFMLYNSAFEIVWASAYMKVNYLQQLKERFPYLNDAHSMTSFWIKRIN
jgi:hypothetical protein